MPSLSRRAVVLGVLPTACGLAAQKTSVPTVEALQRLATSALPDDRIIEVLDPGRGGRFRWEADSAEAPDGGTIFASQVERQGRWVRVVQEPLDAVWFGASPANSAAANSAAFRAASRTLASKGGTLIVRPGRYLVGVQRLVGVRGKGAAYATESIIQVDGARKPISLLGRGVTLKCAPRLRYGQFDPLTGQSTHHALSDPDYRSTPYGYMIDIRNCSAPVYVVGFELDGSLEQHVLGGLWGDRGRQIQATGIYSYKNVGGVEIVDIWTHHHALDGITIEHEGLGPRSPRYPVTLTNVRSEYNARQGLSWVGGTQLTAIRCSFNQTGRAGFSSSPAAGVDMEAESSVCRNGRFIDCEFVENVGAGFLGDSGDGADAVFERCRFVGTSYFALWPRLPGLKFNDCKIVGTLVNVFPSKNPDRATQFNDCLFANGSNSANGEVYSNLLAELGGGATNVLFNRCIFDAQLPEGALPWSPIDTRYHGCKFRQVGTTTSYTRGVFTGLNRFTTAGKVDFSGSAFRGIVVLNGRRLSR